MTVEPRRISLPVFSVCTAGAPARAQTPAGAGWERRFVVAPPRLEEAVALYRELGYEVALAPAQPADLPDACGGPCIDSQHQVVFTRRV